MKPVQIASDEENRFFLDQVNKSRGQWIGLIIQTTFRGKPNLKKVAKRRAKNKVARKQRRINRLRSKH